MHPNVGQAGTALRMGWRFHGSDHSKARASRKPRPIQVREDAYAEREEEQD